MKVKKNDMVLVTTGKDRGKKGKVLKIFPERDRAIVEGICMARKHMRRTRDNPKGGILLREVPIQISNLAFICPRCNQPTRVGYTVLADGSRKRICRKCKEIQES